MRVIMHRSLLLMLIACGGPEEAPPPVDSAVATHGPPALAEVLAESGFVVTAGDFSFATMESCCDPGANCWGNNPSTPYGMHLVPASPGQALPSDDAFHGFGAVADPALSRTFHMEPHEALLLMGYLPPQATYLGYASYLGWRPGAPYAVIGSLGPAWNNQVIAEAGGIAPNEIWGEPFALITSGDAAVEEQVRAALLAAGWAPGHIHVDRISPEIARLGHGPEADLLFTLLRVAVFEDPLVGEAWREAPGLTMLRLTAEPEAATSPHPIPELPARGSGTDEEAWRTAVTELHAAIGAYHGDYVGEQLAAIPYWAETIDCITSSPIGCTGDIRDRFVAITLPLLLASDEFLVVFGVNHARTGKATYASAAVQSIAGQRGIEAISSAEMPGTAATYLPGHPLLDDLYAWTVARSCAGLPEPCTELAAECPGIAYDETFKVTVRAYLEPATGAAPLPTEMVGDQIVIFRPRAP